MKKKRENKQHIAKLFAIGNLEAISPRHKRLICGNCGNPPHWFEKACTPEIEALYAK